MFGRRYRPRTPIPATPKKPLFIAALKPKPGATVIPLGGPGNPPLGVEWKVGRGRVLMLGRRPDRPRPRRLGRLRHVGPPGRPPPPRGAAGRTTWAQTRPDGMLSRPATTRSNGPDLTSVRYLSPRPRRADPADPRRGRPADLDTSLPAGRTSISPYVSRSPSASGSTPSALPRLSRDDAREGLGDQDPRPAVRPQGDPGLHPRPGPAELADLPVRASAVASGPGSSCRRSRWGSPSASSGPRPTTWATTRRATRST